MANQNEIGWNYGTAIDGNLRKTKCNFCNKLINGSGVTRLKEHLAGVGSDVSACLIVPKEVKQLVRSHIVQKRNGRNKRKLHKQRLEELMRPQQVPDNEDIENEDDEEVRRVMRESKETYRDEEMHRSQRQSGGGSSQTERNVRGRSTRVDGDFDTHAATRIDSYMKKRGDLLNVMLHRKMGKRRKHGIKKATKKKLKVTNVLEADQDSKTEENDQESNVLRKLNDEILIVDEAGYIYLGDFVNTAVEFCHETAVGEPLIVAEDVMYVDESGTIYGSLVEYPSEVGLEIVEKTEENEEQSENILYVDEVGNIFLSMNTNKKFIESVTVLPLEIFDDEQRREKSDSDLETEMKIKRLKEEICSLEERIKYIESSASASARVD